VRLYVYRPIAVVVRAAGAAENVWSFVAVSNKTKTPCDVISVTKGIANVCVQPAIIVQLPTAHVYLLPVTRTQVDSEQFIVFLVLANADPVL
jgi:hypothetical protein